MSFVKLKFTLVSSSFNKNHPVLPRTSFSSLQSGFSFRTFIPSAISVSTLIPYRLIPSFFESSLALIPSSPAFSISLRMPSSSSALIAWNVRGANAIFCASNLASMARMLSCLYLSIEKNDLSIIKFYLKKK